MKLHKDGTIEGTPQEIAEYNRLITQPFPPLHNETEWQKALRMQQGSSPLLPNSTLKPVITSDSLEQQRAYGCAYTGGQITSSPMFNSDTKPE